jgi:hypothetical protein
MQTFYLKYRDVMPILEVTLLNPDKTVHDLTGSTSYKLHIWLRDGGKLTRTMTLYGLATAGTLRYQWLATDWTDAVAPLVVGQNRMEYEVLGPGAARLTWPNDGYDELRIVSDVGQG